MKNTLIKICSLIALMTSIFSTSASATIVNDESNNIPIVMNLSLYDLEKNSETKSIDGKIVNKIAYMPYTATIKKSGLSIPYKLTIEIPYTTYEDQSGKSIYSVDDNNIASYLNYTATLQKYSQDYAYSQINSSKTSAKILGFGKVTANGTIDGIGIHEIINVDFNVTIKPTSGK